MGHTVSSQRQMVDRTLAELLAYSKALRSDERIIYENLLKKALSKVGTIGYANSIHVWATVLLSIMLEQEKKS